MIQTVVSKLGPLLTDWAAAAHPAGWLSAGARMVTADRSEIGRYAAEQGSRLNATQGLLVLGGLIVLISGAALATWLQKRPPLPVVLLFNRLAREAGLAPADRVLLYWMARRHGAAAPLAPLLCPGTLGAWAREHAGTRAGRRSGPRHFRAVRLARAASIRRQLFGTAPPPPSPQPVHQKL